MFFNDIETSRYIISYCFILFIFQFLLIVR